MDRRRGQGRKENEKGKKESVKAGHKQRWVEQKNGENCREKDRVIELMEPYSL